MTAKRLAVISAGLSQPSSTRLLADRLVAAVERRLADKGIALEIDVYELRDTAQDVTNNLLTGFANPTLEAVIESVTTADGLVAVTPIFTTSYSGLFKSFIDVIDPQALADMPVLIGATGGSERHSLALDYAMRPLFTYLHANTVPTGVYAASGDWGHGADSATSSLPERIERAAGELAALIESSDRSSRIIDPFALPTGFSPVGCFGAQ
ncbi:FMN reductase [soil metagenome]